MKVQKLTPNLIVRDVAASMAFYQTVLGLQPAIKVPDEPPYVFGSVSNGSVEIFFNEQKSVAGDVSTARHAPDRRQPDSVHRSR